MDFVLEVFSKCKKVPKGKVITYKALAIAIGKPHAFRAVGNALNKNKNFDEVPCHRVVRSDGSIGGYVKGTKQKEKLLISEGIEIKNEKIDLGKFGIVF
jgi:methylated-DNA-[protein]-cysteine S-methyltransferase